MNLAQGGEIPPLRDDEFRLFRELIRKEAGINLGDHKRALLVARLARRLRELGCRSFSEYYGLVVAEESTELVQLLDRISTNETRFFREPQHFEYLERHVYPRWKVEKAERGERSVRIWSAACSTGEEPFSLAMSLLAHFPSHEGWSVEVTATDLCTRVLSRAEAATWSLERAAQIPSAYLKQFMLKGFGSQAGLMRATPELRAVVRLARLNLVRPPWPELGTFDAIFCRNVLIYFGLDEKRLVIEALQSHLGADGHMFLGHAETLNGLSSGLRVVLPTVYVRPAQVEAGAGLAQGASR